MSGETDRPYHLTAVISVNPPLEKLVCATTMHSAPVMAADLSRNLSNFGVSGNGFPSFLPKEVERIKDPFARMLATRIERLPVQISFSEKPILSSCVRPLMQHETNPVVLLHGFDSSCLEWSYTFPLLEEAGLETWALDILGWGFSDLGTLPLCNVESKREHLYQVWRSYIRRPMILVGPSLGAAVAVDFALNHSEAVEKLIIIDGSIYTECTGKLSRMPRTLAYAGVSLLKSVPLRLYAQSLAFHRISFQTIIDITNVSRLHCLLPWWKDAAVDFMMSGGYQVSQQIKQIKQETLIIWGTDDQFISNKDGVKLNSELPNSTLHQISNCGHLPHVEKADSVSKLIVDFVQGGGKIKPT